GVGGWGGGGRAGGVPAGAAARGSSRLPRWNGHGAASRRPGRPRGVRPRWPRGRGNPEGCRRGRGGETAGGTGARWGWANPWRRRSGGCRSPVARAGRSPDGSGQGWEVAWSNLAKSWAGDQPTHYCTNVVGRSNLVSGFRDQTSCRVTLPLPSSWFRVVRWRWPRASVSSTGASSHILISFRTKRSLMRRDSDFINSAWGIASKYPDRSPSTTSV